MEPGHPGQHLAARAFFNVFLIFARPGHHLHVSRVVEVTLEFAMTLQSHDYSQQGHLGQFLRFARRAFTFSRKVLSACEGCKTLAGSQR